MKKVIVLLTVVLAIFTLAMGISAADTECTEHRFGSAVITVAPTCKQDGIVTYTCSVCGEIETKAVEATHNYSSEVTVKATCTTQGTVTHKCVTCGVVTTTSTEPIHAYEEEVLSSATCNSVGKTRKTCALCGASEIVDVAASHTPTKDGAELLRAPSCFFEGSVRFDCTVCGENVTVAIPKRHENEAVITTAPTCTTPGILRHTCIYCKTTHVDTISPKHTFEVHHKDDLTGAVVKDIPSRIVYSDYTKTGVMFYTCTAEDCNVEEGVIANPIFIFSGYARTDYDASIANCKVEIAAGYSVDYDALELYLQVAGRNNDTFEFGIVGAVKSHLQALNPGSEGDVAPLESSTAKPLAVATDSDNFIVKKIKLKDKAYSSIDGRLVNIDYDNHPTYFYLCLYVYDGTKTVYISDDSCRDVPLPISYAMLNNSGGADHDDVSMNTISFGGKIGYSTILGTQPDQDRLDLIATSADEYSTQDSTQNSVNDENTIASIGNIGSWVGTVPNANDLLNYYLELGGDATHYDQLDVEELLNDSSDAEESWMASINYILRAAEFLAIEGETVNIDQSIETEVQLSKPSSGVLGLLGGGKRDWYLSFIDGYYYTDTDLNNLKVTYVEDENGAYKLVDGEYVEASSSDRYVTKYSKQYSAEIVYTVIDYYSFYEYRNDTSTDSFLLWGPSKKELAQLHLDGNALDFLIESTVTYSAVWKEGQRPFKDADFGDVTVMINDVETPVTDNYTRNNSILTVVSTSKDN